MQIDRVMASHKMVIGVLPELWRLIAAQFRGKPASSREFALLFHIDGAWHIPLQHNADPFVFLYRIRLGNS
jgi:hypothetical protein